MNPERKEPAYLYSEKQVADKSGLARKFLDTRTVFNENVEKADNFLVKRFYNLDHNPYLDGAVPAKYKEAAIRRARGVVEQHRAVVSKWNKQYEALLLSGDWEMQRKSLRQ